MSKKLVNILIISLSVIITLSVILAICFQTRAGVINGDIHILPGSILSVSEEYSVAIVNGLYYTKVYFITLSDIFWLCGITVFNGLCTLVLLLILNKFVLNKYLTYNLE